MHLALPLQLFVHMQELFGPLSMRALEDDKYVRQVSGYLPTAEVSACSSKQSC